MHANSRTFAVAVASLAATGALIAGCSSDTTDAVKDQVGQAADSAKDKAGDAVDSAKDKAGDAADAAKDKLDGATGDKADDGSGDAEGTDGAQGSGDSADVPNAEITGADGPIEVTKPIAEKYEAVGGAQGHLGEPVGEQQQGPDGGYHVDFQGASIYWSPATEAHFVQGKIKDAWLADGGTEKLGYPTSDEHTIDDGLQSDFQHGHITYIDDQTEVVAD